MDARSRSTAHAVRAMHVAGSSDGGYPSLSGVSMPAGYGARQAAHLQAAHLQAARLHIVLLVEFDC